MSVQTLFQKERLGLPCWTMILAIGVVVDESNCLDILILEFLTICEHLPFSLGYKPILRLLLVPSQPGSLDHDIHDFYGNQL